MKIAVITDSGSGFTKTQADALGVYYLPLQILIRDQMYLDGENISLGEVYQFLEKGEMPTTSMPPIGIIEQVFEQIKKDGFDEVIAIPLSSGLSSTSSVLQVTAKELGLSLHTIETYTTCEIQKYLVTCAKTLVDQGIDVNEIVTRLNESIKESGSFVVPNDLQHLKRGGRLTPLAAALGGLLKIKPVLQLNAKTGGKIDVYDKVRTLSKALKTTVSTVSENNLDSGYQLIVLQSKAQEEAEKVKELLETSFPNTEVVIGNIGPVISVHTGLGCIAIQYIKKIQM